MCVFDVINEAGAVFKLVFLKVQPVVLAVVLPVVKAPGVGACLDCKTWYDHRVV